ncbi:MbnP family protein [Ferruginibacter sp.]
MVSAAIKRLSVSAAALFIVIICSSSKDLTRNKKNTGPVKISFVHSVKTLPLVLDSMEYSNPFNETYRVSSLKYYISNIVINSNKQSFKEPESYHLIDAADSSSWQFGFDVVENDYSSISFMIGVDSIKNVSGAQTGALDPLHGMFWTWNSGYIFFKLEGHSPVSNMFNKKIEYHIGGFSGANNALRTVTLQFPAGSLLQVKKGKETELVINADIDQLWQATSNLQIATTPATMTPGPLSIKIADNYSRMFTIKEVINH